MRRELERSQSWRARTVLRASGAAAVISFSAASSAPCLSAGTVERRREINTGKESDAVVEDEDEALIS